MNIGVQRPFGNPVFNSLEYMPRSEIAGLHGSYDTIHENKLRMVEIPKYKTWHTITPRREHRQNIL